MEWIKSAVNKNYFIYVYSYPLANYIIYSYETLLRQFAMVKSFYILYGIYFNRRYTDTHITFYINTYIKTHDSELRGQEVAGHMRRTSELFTGSIGLKFVNTLNKLP